MKNNESNRMGDVPTVEQSVAEEIQKVVEGSTVSVVDKNTIKIQVGDVISSVRVRENKRGAGYKITHNGKGSKYEDAHADVIGEVYNDKVSINKNKINKIASESTDWDRHTIAEAIATKFEDSIKEEMKHPSFGTVDPYFNKEVIGVSIEIVTPNNEDWEKMKSSKGTIGGVYHYYAEDFNPKHSIPSGKTVMKMITESDVDAHVSREKVIRIQGTIEQVGEIVRKITGNPMEW